jgi:amino acid adenylation domain-containing protein
MTIYSLVNKYNAQGISLWQKDGQLKFKAPKGALTDDFREELIANKEDIIAFFQRVSERSKIPPILPVSRAEADGRPIESFPLSFAQERLWFIDQLDPDSAGYNIPEAVTISGGLDIDHLEQAFNLMIARHENLRTIFPSLEGQAQQVILDSLDFKLERIDLSHYKSNETRHQKAKQLCQNESAAPFDLAKGPLIRGKLIKLTAQERILMLTMHHIITDAWSTEVFIKEFGLIMDCLAQGKSPDLPPLPIQYLDYSIWQRKLLGEGGLLQQQLAYWQEKLAGVPASLNLVTDYPRPSVQSFSGARQAFSLDAGLTSQLKSLAEQQGCTLYMTLLAAFKVLLYRYTGHEDICLGSPIANRQYEETQSLIGMFVNTLALRSQLEGGAPFISLLAQVKTTCLEAYEHQDTPFEKIVDLVQPERNLALSPLFQIMFILQNAPKESTEQHIQSYPLKSDISKFDLTIALTDTLEGLEGSIEYRTSLYNQQTIERMVNHFTGLCQAIISTPTAKICTLDYISEGEKQKLLIDYNNTQTDSPKEKCIQHLFIEQVAINPDKPAVVYAGQDTNQPKQLSYQELYDKSYDLALYLQFLGIQPDNLVGLCMERSLDMIVGIMGILQAGGAYVPLDPDYPEERLEYILENSQAPIVLTQDKLKQKLSSLIPKNTKLITLDQRSPVTENNQQQSSALHSGYPYWPEIATCVADLKSKKVKLRQEVKPEHLSYVIYTSGSTGKPKGVLLKHKTLTNLISWQLEARAFKETGNIINFTGTNFDVFMQEISSCFSSGCSFIIPDVATVRDTALLGKFIVKNNINKIFLPYVALTYLLEELTVHYHEIPLKYIITAGEQLVINEKVKNFFEKYPYVQLYNHYGPSESHVVTSYTLPKDVNTWKVFPSIGAPIDNTQIYILDPYHNPVPIGVPGELHIAGDGLARGYNNRPELTEERFIPNPFKPGATMYKSGDLARWLEDVEGRPSNIEYLGRIDTQVKIRGFRIETGEIEAQLNQHPELKDSVVIVQGQEGNKKLIAYYVARDTKEEHIIDLAHEDLRAYLQQTLPEYMLPAAFVSLEKIPLTPNGKVNRRLLESTVVNLESSQAYLAPRNTTEKQLVAIWAEVLNLEPEKIGVNDNFFELGGHSLLATQLISRIRSQFAIDLPLKALFKQASIAGFTPLIVKAERSKIPPILPVSRTEADGHPIESFPLSFAQERLWFIDQLEPDSAGYNIPGAATICGGLDIDHLEQAFNLMIARHENLRTIFPSQEGQAQQVILDSLDFKLERIDLSHYKSNKTRHKKARQLCHTEAATPFDLTGGPLIRGKLIKLIAQEHILMLTMHHIISDGWSMGVMIKEFGLIMDCLRQGQSPDLPPLPIQYLDYSIWQRKLLGEGAPEQESLLRQQLAYWQEKLTGVPESLNLATDYPRSSVQSFSGARQAFSLDAGLTSQLKSLAEQQGCTLYMTLLAAFKVLLYRYTNQEDICLGSAIANRQYEETESLIGMFVNTLALRSQLEGGAPFISLLAQVKTTCLEAYEHQDTPFEKIVDLVQPERNMGISALFQIMFVLQNAPKESTEQHIQSYPLDSDISKFDLTIAFTETPEGLEGSIEYRTSLYKQQTIERMAQHFRAICQAITTTPSAKISDLEFIGEAEKHQLLIGYNNTQADYPQDKCIHQLFIEQVAINPDKIAVVYQDEALSYQQLYDKSHDLALYLQSLGVQPDRLVGLHVERSLEMMVGILGILQAGGAYLPLDPDYPKERLTYMLKDSQAAIVLTQEKLKDKLNSLVEKGTKLITFDQRDGLLQRPEIAACVSHLNSKKVKLHKEVKPHHLAYVIYTSGSTGKSKGVAIEHKSVINMIHSQIEEFSITNNDKCLQNFSICFDGAVSEIYTALLSGASLVITPKEEQKDTNKFITYLRQHKVSWTTVSPSFLTAIGKQPLALRVLVTAGETANNELFQYHSNNQVACYNAYGPTEASVCVTVYPVPISENEFSNSTSTLSSTPIGMSINNTQTYILDQHNNPVPTGVPGELHIAGDGLARGYLNRPELTREKFIANPFNPGTRMYKSGDLARWLGDSNIEYLGRIDTQVKIRGFRIELGEIEAQLNQYPEIKDSVVIAQGQEGKKQLIAYYYVAIDTKDDHIINLANEDLRAYLQQTLPDYMLPAAFVSLEAIPLTPNGKVDRRALERMDVNLESSQAYLAPRNTTEKQLVAIWAEVLNLEPEKIGVNDNFFELGGHSLLAVRLMAKINTQFKQSLPLAILFSAPSTAALTKLILSKKEGSFDVLVPIQIKGDKPPIFAVPGAGGNVLSFQPFGHALGDKQPFYGLQAVGLDGKTSPLDSIEKTAKANITALQSIQPTGPYRLIGHSYGGVVAYEMARILLEQNEKIASLILLDSFAPSVIQKRKTLDEMAMLFEVCTTLANLYGLNLNLDITQLQQVSKNKRSKYISNILNSHGIDITTEQFTTFYNVFKANQLCYLTYRPSILSHKIDVSLYRASERHQDRGAMSNDYGWNQLLLNPIQIYDVKANHFSMLDKNHIQQIVKKIVSV